MKASLALSITEFISKATVASIELDMKSKAIKNLTKIDSLNDDNNSPDLMMELCQFNPADPSCLQKGNRVSGDNSYAQGDFSVGGEGTNNALGDIPNPSSFGNEGAKTNLDNNNQVASINSPFSDEAQEAKGILNPADPAVIQGPGGASGGGRGGGGGGGGGGGASLGNDLEGKNKEPDGATQIKPEKVSGVYGSQGGAGYKGVRNGKDDSNPFSSLFDKKDTQGGVEEDRSISSGDIDVKSIGLFQKISKRYGQVHADKRIETNNLE
jgi:hypothetical protein